MIRNYFKLAWRNLMKDKQFTFLNLVGLSTGLACVLLIYLWVHDELEMDKFHQNDSRLFQVMQNIQLGDGGIETSDHTPDLLAKSLKEEMPEIEDVATIKFPDRDGNPEGIISLDQSDVTIKAKELFATPNFFDVFSFHLLEGCRDIFNCRSISYSYHFANYRLSNNKGSSCKPGGRFTNGMIW